MDLLCATERTVLQLDIAHGLARGSVRAFISNNFPLRTAPVAVNHLNVAVRVFAKVMDRFLVVVRGLLFALLRLVFVFLIVVVRVLLRFTKSSVLLSSGAAAPLLLAVRVGLAVGGGLQAVIDADLTDRMGLLAVEIFRPFVGAQIFKVGGVFVSTDRTARVKRRFLREVRLFHRHATHERLRM